MPDWVFPTILLSYTGLVVLLALAGVFSETEARRTAAFQVLRVMLPWGVLTVAAQAVATHFTTST
ncbi:hypothetical protein ABZ738_04610 [Micromonospora sp. NPDC047793]|uniref:hypothetical protein n=1 Tax=Micromonospora sp. NPDC047793 TaxID=3154342 RepID=UPI0034012D39